MITGQRVHARHEWHRPDWHDDAACRGHPHAWMWHPTNHEGTDVTAQAICNTCPVRPECLAHAIEHNEFEGIWGGVPAPERQRMRARHYRGLVV